MGWAPTRVSSRNFILGRGGGGGGKLTDHVAVRPRRGEGRLYLGGGGGGGGSWASFFLGGGGGGGS